MIAQETRSYNKKFTHQKTNMSRHFHVFMFHYLVTKVGLTGLKWSLMLTLVV